MGVFVETPGELNFALTACCHSLRLVFLWTPDKAGWYLQDVFSSSVGLPSDSIPVSSGRGLQASQDEEVKDGKQVIFRRKSLHDRHERSEDVREKRTTPCVRFPFPFVCEHQPGANVRGFTQEQPNSCAFSLENSAIPRNFQTIPPVRLLSCHSTKSLENLASDTGTNTVLGKKKKKKTPSFSPYYPHFDLHQKVERQCQTLGLLIKSTNAGTLIMNPAQCKQCSGLYNLNLAVYKDRVELSDPSRRWASSRCLAQEHLPLSTNVFWTVHPAFSHRLWLKWSKCFFKAPSTTTSCERQLPP